MLPLPPSPPPSADIYPSSATRFPPLRPAWYRAVYPEVSAGRSSGPYRWPMVAAHFPATSQSPWQSVEVPRWLHRTEGASVGETPSLSRPVWPLPRVSPRPPSPYHQWCQPELAPGGGQVTSPDSPRSVSGPPGVWHGAPPSPGPPFLCTGPPVGGLRPSPVQLSTAPPSGASHGAPGCGMFVTGAPPSPPSGRRWGIPHTLATCPPPASNASPLPRRPVSFWCANGWPGMQCHAGLVAGSPSERQWTAPSYTVCPASPWSPPPESRRACVRLSHSACQRFSHRKSRPCLSLRVKLDISISIHGPARG